MPKGRNDIMPKGHVMPKGHTMPKGRNDIMPKGHYHAEGTAGAGTHGAAAHDITPTPSGA